MFPLPVIFVSGCGMHKAQVMDNIPESQVCLTKFLFEIQMNFDFAQRCKCPRGFEIYGLNLPTLIALAVVLIFLKFYGVL